MPYQTVSLSLPPSLQSHFSRRQHRQAQRQQQQLPEWHCSPALSPGLAHEGCPTHAAVASALAAGSIGAAARPQAAARQELAREGGAAAAEAGHHSGGTCSASAGASSRDRHSGGRGAGDRGAGAEGGAHGGEAEAQALLGGPQQAGQRRRQRHGQLDTNRVIGLMLTEAGIIFHSGGCHASGAQGQAPARVPQAAGGTICSTTASRQCKGCARCGRRQDSA